MKKINEQKINILIYTINHFSGKNHSKKCGLNSPESLPV